ncbi:MAG: alkaline phosphatase family protein [Nitrosotalea sp.]
MTKILTTTIIGLLITSLVLSSTGWAVADDESNNQVVATTTPVKHLVVIFDENISFDHYFGTYPYATNPSGEPKFVASENTPSVNGLTGDLLNFNPNLVNPFRLDRSQAFTCKSSNDYQAEQLAADGGLMDQFVQNVGTTGSDPLAFCKPDKSTTMGYFDGNTVTALWNYAQNFAMSDNSYSTTFGASGPGEYNLVSGNTYQFTPANIPTVAIDGTAVDDVDPTYDDCSDHTPGNNFAFVNGSNNVGLLLDTKGVTWGWFQGGFKPDSPYDGVHPVTCSSTHTNISGEAVPDYDQSHNPFQYFAATSNPHHLAPTSVSMIGKQDQANHLYDLSDFWTAVDSGNMPAVSYLKPLESENGHGAISDPLDEQKFLVSTINHLEKTPEWKDTAVIILWDDSGGWYDHQYPPIINQSNGPEDHGCGTAKAGAIDNRCGHGPRQPLLVISPFAKENFVDHTMTDQTSVLKFIEDNWSLGRIGNQSFDVQANSLDNMFDFEHGNADKLFLDPTTGEKQ